MKTLKIDNIAKFLFLFLAIGLGYILQSCDDDPDKYESTGGVPEVFYIRMGNPEAADSLIEASYMETTICLVGNNLRSIREIYFNDQKAILNTSFITDHTLFVTIPKTIPTDVSNTMYMVAQKDTVKYPFSVLVPAPLVRRISNEYAHDNTEAILYGDYFIDDPSKPLTITMAGNIPVTEITSIEKTKVVFKVPEGAEKGYMNVSSIYGTSRSKFQFRDDRGMILDWDNLTAKGWRPGVIKENDPVEGISGKYVYFAGDIPGDNSDWGEDGFSFNLWGKHQDNKPELDLPEGDLFDIDIETALLKFEINVPEAWSANALQMIFTPWGTTGTNGYIADGTTPRGLWYPWRETGSYTTDGWVTVSFPLKDFKYDHTGKELSVASPGNWGGLTFFVYHGGVEGTECSPKICIDNIRVVPAE